MLDFEHKTLPISLASLFTLREEVHDRNLRDKNKNKIYTAYRVNNRYGYDSFTRHVAILLNKAKDLPFYDKGSSKITFLSKYKCNIFDTYSIFISPFHALDRLLPYSIFTFFYIVRSVSCVVNVAFIFLYFMKILQSNNITILIKRKLS